MKLEETPTTGKRKSSSEQRVQTNQPHELRLILFVVLMETCHLPHLPVRIHADLSFDCDVLPWAQTFEYTAFVREALKPKENIILLLVLYIYEKQIRQK